MRLPQNMQRRRSMHSELQALEDSGELKKLYLYFCKRLEELETNVDADKNLYLDDTKVTINQLWLIFRKDIAKEGFKLSKEAALHVITKGTEKIIADASAIAAKDNCRVIIGFSHHQQ